MQIREAIAEIKKLIPNQSINISANYWKHSIESKLDIKYRFYSPDSIGDLEYFKDYDSIQELYNTVCDAIMKQYHDKPTDTAQQSNDTGPKESSLL